MISRNGKGHFNLEDVDINELVEFMFLIKQRKQQSQIFCSVSFLVSWYSNAFFEFVGLPTCL